MLPGNAGRRNGEDPAAEAPYARPVPDPCRFCGAANRQITKEHILPHWLRDYLPTVPEPGDVERCSPSTKRQRLPHPFLQTTVRPSVTAATAGGWPTLRPRRADRRPNGYRPGWISKPMHSRSWPTGVALKGLGGAQASKRDQWIPESHCWHVHNSQGAPPDRCRLAQSS
jgi:hypothetical protein